MPAATWVRCLCQTVKWSLWALVALLGCYSLHQFLLPVVAFVFPTLDAPFYDLGVFGVYPTRQYSSFHLESPQPRLPRWDPTCDEGIVLLTLNGPYIERPGPMMLDGRGDLVWMEDSFGHTSNLKIQQYQGQDYITFWAGQKAATSGKGIYVMLNSSYEVAKKINAVGEGLHGDLHEFKITPEGTALITVYNKTSADLTGLGLWRGVNGWIVDTLFQEIDIETGELLFQWKASDHFELVETFMTNPFGGFSKDHPFDWYHLNSVEKDSRGNYIISSRHFHHVVCISPTGETLWILGGRHNQFTDLSEGHATDFRWQHDVRWFSEEEGVLSLIDNQKAGVLHMDAPASRALLLRIDVQNRTVELVHSLGSLQGILASSQGSVQRLPSDGIFVGWGSAAAYSEYARDGTLMCETHLSASLFYAFDQVKSYRATKAFGWVGTPRSPPDVKVEDGLVHVSWNGATEVAFWALETDGQGVLDEAQSSTEAESNRRVDDSADGHEEGIFEMIDVIPKFGFEGSFVLPTTVSGQKPRPARYRVAAMDRHQNVLRYSRTIDRHSELDGTASTWTVLLFKLFIVAILLFGLRIMFRQTRAARWLPGWKRNGSSRESGNPPAWMEWRLRTQWQIFTSGRWSKLGW